MRRKIRNRTVRADYLAFVWNFRKASYNTIDQKSCFYGSLSNYIFLIFLFCFQYTYCRAYFCAFTSSLCRRSSSDINIPLSLYAAFTCCIPRVLHDFVVFPGEQTTRRLQPVVQIRQFPNGSRLEDNTNFSPIHTDLELSQKRGMLKNVLKFYIQSKYIGCGEPIE